MSEQEDYSLIPFLEREQTKENTIAAYKAGAAWANQFAEWKAEQNGKLDALLAKAVTEQVVEMTPKWISVKERLPEECVLVLGYREIMDTLSVVFLSSQGKWMFAYEPEFASDITHWMPLPDAPKEEK